MLRGLTRERQLLLEKQNLPWKFCSICKHRPKPEYTEAVVICTDCNSVYCENHLTGCSCQADD